MRALPTTTNADSQVAAQGSCDLRLRAEVRSSAWGRWPCRWPRNETTTVMSCASTITKLTSAQVRVVVRGGVEPPTFRFSGIGITVYRGAGRVHPCCSPRRVDAHRPWCMNVNETKTETSRDPHQARYRGPTRGRCLGPGGLARRPGAGLRRDQEDGLRAAPACAPAVPRSGTA